jgi:Domain of unknown function (DUF5710)
MDLSKKFLNGLLNTYGITESELDNYNYCGGDTEEHKRYFKIYFKNCLKTVEMPSHKDKCVCGHRIKRNCFITNDIDILVIGNCCIKKFMKNSGRTCNECGAPHKNIKINKCNDCKKEHLKRRCLLCDDKLNNYSEDLYCDECMTNKCNECGDYCGLYKLCEFCYKNKKCIKCGENSGKYKKCLTCKNNEIKIYFDVPFIDKDCFKKLNGLFDNSLKKWYVYDDNIHIEFIKNNWNLIDL